MMRPLSRACFYRTQAKRFPLLFLGLPCPECLYYVSFCVKSIGMPFILQNNDDEGGRHVRIFRMAEFGSLDVMTGHY